MNLKFYAIILLTVGTFSLFACKDDDGPGDAPCLVAWATDLQDEINGYYTAAVAYSSNPNTENCNAYKAALQAYLNALQPYGDCATLSGADRQSWQEAIEEAQESINDIAC